MVTKCAILYIVQREKRVKYIRLSFPILHFIETIFIDKIMRMTQAQSQLALTFSSCAEPKKKLHI